MLLPKLGQHHPTRPPFDARAVVGTLSALILGWLVFEPYLLTAIGCEQRDQRGMRQQVVQVLQRIIGLAKSRSACELLAGRLLSTIRLSHVKLVSE